GIGRVRGAVDGEGLGERPARQGQRGGAHPHDGERRNPRSHPCGPLAASLQLTDERNAPPSRDQRGVDHPSALLGQYGVVADDVEIVRRAMEALNDGRAEDALATIDPEIVWYPNVNAPEFGPYIGMEGLLRLRQLLDDSFEEFSLDAAELIACGDG